MSKELFIQYTDNGIDIALLEDRRLFELQHDNLDEDFMVGDIFLGKVKKIATGLNAVFIDIGHQKESFLHYLDLGPDIRTFNKFFHLVKTGKFKDSKIGNFRFEKQIEKTGQIAEVFEPGQEVVVQIVKEPIGTKGHRLTSQLSISGRLLILMPFSDSVSLSKKIKSREERDRLRSVLAQIRPKGFGVIIRTNAEGADENEIKQDFARLIEAWDKMIANLGKGEIKIHTEMNRANSILRDMIDDSFSRVVVDSPQLQNQIKKYLSEISPDYANIVKLYKGEKSLFEYSDIEKQMRSLFNKIVNLGGGAYLIIEHTEAMHVIDVNSGSKRSKDERQEESALKTNIEAVQEIARQLRLRDMGGIVVVDFIDMRNRNNRKLIYDTMKEAMEKDRAKHTILPLSKFGILQITRQRVRQELNHDESETCPLCGGTGELNTEVEVVDFIEQQIQKKATEGVKEVTIQTHPYVHAYLTKGWITNTLKKWKKKYKIKVKSIPNEEHLYYQFKIE